MTDFDYKKYSLENLENWMHDAISSAEATPQEIYDVIKGVVEEQYHYFKSNTQHCYELLALLNGNGKGHIEAYDNSLSCDKDDTSLECKGAWNDFWEENYYPEEYEKGKVKKWVLPVEETKIAETDETEYFITLPDDLLEQTGWKENEKLNWVDNGDGTFTLCKVTEPLGMDEC